MKVKCQMSNVKCPILVVFLAIFLLCGSPALAANATSSAKVSPEPSSSASSSLLQKINEIKEKAASKAADFISEVAKKMQNKAYFGKIYSISGDNIKIELANNSFDISVNEYTKYASSLKNAKKITGTKDLKDGDFISVLGDVDDKGVLNAKKLIKSNPIASGSASLVWGVVQKITGGTIIVKSSDSSEQTVTSYGKSNVFLGQQEGTLADIKPGRIIIARGKQTNSAGLTSTYIYIVPPSADAKPEKTPISSGPATFLASPSASPKKP